MGTRWLSLLRTNPEAVSTGVATAMVVVYSLWVTAFAFEHTHFMGDDLYAFFLSRAEPFSEFLMEPIGVHFVPAHRIVCYVINRLAPLRFGPALGILVVFHALGAIALWWVLSQIRRSSLNPVLVALYCTNAFLGALLLWWTAGLHRLPFIFFGLVSIGSYLRYRRTGGIGWAVSTLSCMSLAAGFYAKALLLPLYLAALDVSLDGEGPRTSIRRRALLVAGSCLLAVAWGVGWRHVVASTHQSLNTDFAFHAEFQLASWWIFLSALAADVYVPGRDYVGIKAAVWLVLIGVTVWRARKNWIPWTSWVLLVSANFLATATSKLRADRLGVAIVLSDRYYFELLFPTALFLAIALGRVARSSGTEPRSLAVRWVGAAVGVALCAFSVMGGVYGAEYLSVNRNAYQLEARPYLEHFRRDMAKLAERAAAPPVFLDEPLPEFLGLTLVQGRTATLLTAIGADARVAGRRDAHYRISNEGRIITIRDGNRKRRGDASTPESARRSPE